MGNNIKIYMIGASADYDMHGNPFGELDAIVEDDTHGIIKRFTNADIYRLPFVDRYAHDVTEFYDKDTGRFDVCRMVDQLYYYKGKRSDKHMYFLAFDVDDNDGSIGTLIEKIYMFSLNNIVSSTIENDNSMPLHEVEDGIITSFKLDIGHQSYDVNNIEIYAVATNAGDKIYENPFGIENTNIELGVHGTIKDMVNSVQIYGVSFPDIAFNLRVTKFYNGDCEDGVLDTESIFDEFDRLKLPKKHVYFLVFKVDNNDNNGTLVDAIYMFSKDTLVSLSNGEMYVSPAEIKLRKGLFVLPDSKQPHSLSTNECKNKSAEVEITVNFKCFPITNDEVNAAAARLLEAFKDIIAKTFQ